MQVNEFLNNPSYLTRLEKIMILESIFNTEYSKIFLNEKFTEPQTKKLKTILDQYNCLIPIEYILNKSFFFENYFYVNENVLIPRAETEVLVEKAITLNPKTILEVGVGSGCIILSILEKLKKSSGLGVDISNIALKVAVKNQLNLKLTNCNFKQSDLLSVIKPSSQFELVIANLPYVPNYSYVSAETYYHEPHLALFAKNEGLALIEKLLRQLIDKKIKFKYLLLEFHYNHAERIKALIDENLSNSKIQIFADYCGRNRFALIEMP